MKVRHRIFSSAFSLGSVRSGGSAQLSRVRNKMSAAAAFLCAKVQVVRRFIFSRAARGEESAITSFIPAHSFFCSFSHIFVNLKVRSCSAERGGGCRARGIRGIRHLTVLAPLSACQINPRMDPRKGIRAMLHEKKKVRLSTSFF